MEHGQNVLEHGGTGRKRWNMGGTVVKLASYRFGSSVTDSHIMGLNSLEHGQNGLEHGGTGRNKPVTDSVLQLPIHI